jgi:hypothetical protein
VKFCQKYKTVLVFAKIHGVMPSVAKNMEICEILAKNMELYEILPKM